MLYLGVSNASWAGFPLPLALAPYGAPGNHVYVSLDVPLLVLTNPGGGGKTPLTIPTSVTSGIFHMQTVFLDPLACPLGVVFSNGFTVRIG